MERSFWNPIVERLSSEATILAYDCRGHGLSGKLPGPYSVESFADDLAELLDQVGWSSALVVRKALESGLQGLVESRPHAGSATRSGRSIPA